MTDPQRLLDDGGTELELQLLRAGDAEGPSPKAQRTTLAALGLGSAVLTTTSSAAAVAASGARVTLAKWWAAGAIAAASVAGGVGYFALSNPTLPSAPRTAEAVPGAVSMPSMGSTTGASSPPERPMSDSMPSSPLRLPAVSARPGGGASSSKLQEEIALIDRARSAAAAGNPAAALTGLDEYGHRFPRGALYQEATMLRIEALLARGDKAAAKQLGRRFLQSHPRSALAPRVRQLLGD